jgi:hypothetical protein
MSMNPKPITPRLSLVGTFVNLSIEKYIIWLFFDLQSFIKKIGHIIFFIKQLILNGLSFMYNSRIGLDHYIMVTAISCGKFTFLR